MTPTFSHGKSGVFKIADSGSTVRDISSVVKTSGLKRAADTAETSAMGSSSKSYIPGLLDGTITLDGYLDTTTAGYLMGVLGLVTTFQYYPSGTAAGNIELSGSCIVNDAEITSDVGAVVTIKGTAQVTGAVVVTNL
jgi:hypothetical protein